MLLEDFLKNELAGKYEVCWHYDFGTNSIIVEMRDGLLKEQKIVSMRDIQGWSHQGFFEFILVDILIEMMNHIDEYRSNEHERLKGENL